MAAEAAARAPDLRESRLGRRCAACPGQVIYCPGAKGAPTGPEVDYTQCASSCGSGARRPHGPPPVGGHPLLPSVAAGNETPEVGLAPARAGLSVTLSPVDTGMLPGAEAAGNETPDADLAPARICFGPT